MLVDRVLFDGRRAVGVVTAYGVEIPGREVILSGGSYGSPDAIASNLASYGHPVATAPMGGPQDPWAVVDSRGAVKGIDGLRVVDASIMPGVPSVALNPTTIMIAERIAKKVYAAELTEAAERPQVIRR